MYSSSSSSNSGFIVVEENIRPFTVMFNDYLSIPDREFKVLFALKSFAWNQKDNCYPSIATLAQLVDKSKRQVSEILNALAAKGLIRIELNPGHRSTYFITNKDLTVKKKASKLSTVRRKSSRQSGGNPHDSQEEILMQSNINNNTKINKKERGTNHITENQPSGTKKQKPLSVFEPNQENKTYALENKIDLSKELESFNQRHKGKKTQYEFKRWLENTKEYLEKKQPKVNRGVTDTRSDWLKKQMDEANNKRQLNH